MIEFEKRISKKDVAERVKHATRVLPLKMGEAVVKFSVNRSTEQNWVDNGTQP